MPDAGKKSAGGAKTDSKAPVIASPSKPKAGAASADKKSSKEAVRLPSIAPSPGSPTKKASKSEPSATSLPSDSPSKAITPTSPSKPSAKQPRPGSKTNLAPVKATNERPLEVEGKADAAIQPAEAKPEGGEETSLGDVNAPEGIQTSLEANAETEAVAAAAAEEAVALTRAREEEEAARLRQENGNGMVKLIYEQYDEMFPIVDGSTTQANIDDVYCLSFVMPNCLVRLSYHPNSERFERENNGIFDSLVPEDPRGTYQNLVKDQTYYVVVEQEADQLRRDQEATKAKWAPTAEQEKLKKDDGRGFESCSCIYGNPCADEYGCKDWHSRFAIATANGWKGF